MTKRLEDALKKLSPDEMETLTRYVESLASHLNGPQPGETPQLKWVGALKASPERSGVEAAKRAEDIRLELVGEGTMTDS